jgi:hypothetical protein
MRQSRAVSVIALTLAALLLTTACNPFRDNLPLLVSKVIPFHSTGNDIRDAAEYATARILASDKNADVAQTYAFLALARSVYHGWQDPLVKQLIQKVEQRRNPDGGFGLSQEAETFGSGDFNPADTTYGITSTDHVGRLYLAAYKAGAIPKIWLVRLVHAVIKLTRIQDGTCVAYSMSEYDAKHPCVYNVVAGVAWFLTTAKKLGINEPGQDAMTRAMVLTNNKMYSASTGLWPYQSDKQDQLQDEAHNGVNVDALVATNPAAGKLAARKRAAAWKPHFPSSYAWARVAVYDCPTLARLGPDLAKEVQNPKTDNRTLAQAAVFDARADAVCNLHQQLF